MQFGERTFLGTSAGLLVFDGLRLATDAGHVPTGGASFGGALAGSMSVTRGDGGVSLWTSAGSGEVIRIDQADRFTGPVQPTATYRHPFQQIFSNAYDPLGDRLYGGQVSGAGLIGWNQASRVAGDAGMHDFAVTTNNYGKVVVAGSQLFAMQFAGTVAVYNDVATLAGARTPITLSVVSGSNASLRDITVSDGALVTVEYTGSGSAAVGTERIYRNIAALTAPRAADTVVTHASLQTLRTARLGADGSLYVLDADGLSIFRPTSGGFTFATELSGAWNDFTLIE